MSTHRQAALGEIRPPASFVRYRFPTPPVPPSSGGSGTARLAMEPAARNVLCNEPRAVVLDWHCDRPGPSSGPCAGQYPWHRALVRGGHVLRAPFPSGALNHTPKSAENP